MNTTTTTTVDGDLTTTVNNELTTVITVDDRFQIWNNRYLFSVASPVFRRHLLPPVNYRLQISEVFGSRSTIFDDCLSSIATLVN
ncbi:unnamed protein product [Lactuca virosa]|uniref:BTB domain-containing protein n=1 Tax=Lactuca virosa TaxID=75947 RepID=A0AAU9MLT0_9ASTR|nr:unnamed protein product [Lactuca virosa]